MSAGDYHRPTLHDQRKRRQAVLLQRSRNGTPRYLTDADWNDGARINRKAVSRLARLGLSGTRGVEAWQVHLDPDNPDANFRVRGGDNTELGAAEAWLGGMAALLYRDVDYRCIMRGGFNETDAFDVHHRTSSVAAGSLTDLHAKMTVNGLVGQFVHVEGAGDDAYEVSANTANAITLLGFDPADYPDMGARPWYWVELGVSDVDVTQPVYLDVHIEDWGVTEDAALNQNPGGPTIECGRREVLIQRMWVRQNAATAEMPVAGYKDITGTQHHVILIGNLERLAGEVGVNDVNDEGVEHYASTPDEVAAARAFFDVCDVDDAVDLATRLRRSGSVVTVGPGSESHAGVYNGPEGLLAALACDSAGARTIFLRNGTYHMEGLGAIVVRRGWTLVGESLGAVILLDSAATALDDVACLRMEAYASVEHLTLLRNVGAGDADMVRLEGRRARGDRLWIRDLKTEGAAVVLQSDGALGGACLERSAVTKVDGCAVRVSSTASLPAVGNTSVTGSLPTSSDIAAEFYSGYGVEVRRCMIRVKDSTANDVTIAAVRVTSADDVRLSDLEIQVDGGVALSVSSVLANSAAPSTWIGRGGVELSGVAVIYQPDAIYAGNTSVVSISSGHVRIDDLRVEALADAGQHPAQVVSVVPTAGATVRVTGSGVRLRCAGDAGLVAWGDASLQFDLSQVEIVPASPSFGPREGVRLICTSALGRVRLEGVRVLCAATTQSAVRCIGSARVVGGFSDGAAVPLISLSGGDPRPQDYIVASFRAEATVDGLVPSFDDCESVSHGGVGFLVYNDSEVQQETVLTNCRVRGDGRTAFGYLVARRTSPVALVDCSAHGVRAQGARHLRGVSQMRVVGGSYYDVGIEWYDTSDGWPAVSASFEHTWASCVRNAVSVTRAKLGRSAVSPGPGLTLTAGYGHVGVASDANDHECLIQDCEMDELDNGVIVPPSASVMLSGGTINRCAIGVQSSGATRVEIQKTHVLASQLYGVFLSGCPEVVLDCDVRGINKQGALVSLIGCGIDDYGVEISGWFSVPARMPLGTAALLIQNCKEVRVLGLRVTANSGVGIRVRECDFSVEIDGCRVEAGAPGIYAIEAEQAYNIGVSRCRLLYGAKFTQCVAVVRATVALRQGIAHVQPVSRVTMSDVTVIGVPSGSNDVIVASGISVSGIGDEPTAVQTVLEECYVRSWDSIGADRTANADGRSAGIRLHQVGDACFVRLTRCRVQNYSDATSGIGILVGDLRYIGDILNDSGFHRGGVGRLTVDGCFLDPRPGVEVAPIVVAVLKSTGHVIRGNTFGIGGLVMALYQEAGGFPITRVDFKGNAAFETDLDGIGNRPYVEQSDFIYLDGGLTDVEWGDRDDDSTILDVVRRTNSVNAYLTFIESNGTPPIPYPDP